MEQGIDAGYGHQVVSRALVGSGVIGLRLDASEHHMRRIESAQPVDAREQLVRDPVHDLPHLARDVRMQPAEIGDAGRRPHAAEETVALDQQDFPARPSSSRGGRDPGRPAAEDDDLVVAVHRDLTFRLANERSV